MNDVGHLRGVWVAMVTPLDATTESPRKEVVRSLIWRFSKAGVRGLFILGTTGEGTLLSPEARAAFAEAVLRECEGKLLVIVHTGHDCPEVVRWLSLHAERSGAAGIAVAPPCRYRLTFEELKAHYLSVAEAVSNIPVFLYDIPATTGNPLSGELLRVLHRESDAVAGAKISRGDWEAWEDYLELAGKLLVLAGKDEMAFPLLLLGAGGLVSSGANLFPELYVSLYRSAHKAYMERGIELQKLVIKLCRITRRGSVPWIKQALELLGWDVGSPLRPLLPLTQEERAQLNAELKGLAVETAQWLTEGG